MKRVKYDFSKENPYNTFGKTEFLNANTGETVRTVTEDWRTAEQRGILFVNDINHKSNFLKFFHDELDLTGIICEGVEQRIYSKKEVEELSSDTVKIIYNFLKKKGKLKDALDLAESDLDIKLGIVGRLPFAVLLDDAVPFIDSVLPYVQDIELPILHTSDIKQNIESIPLETLKFLLDRESSL